MKAKQLIKATPDAGPRAQKVMGLLADENAHLRKRTAQLLAEIAELRGIGIQELLKLESEALHAVLKPQAKSEPSSNQGSERSPGNPRQDEKRTSFTPPKHALEPKQETLLLELDEADQICPECGASLARAPHLDDTSELFDIEPQIVVHYKITRAKYRCTDSDCSHLETALGHPEQFRKGGQVTAGFVATLLAYKFLLSLPLHRQLRLLADAGFATDDKFLWDNCWHATTLLKPVYKAIQARVREADLAHFDDGGWTKRKGKTRLWLRLMACGDAVVMGVVAKQDNEAIDRFIGDFKGVLVTDGVSTVKTALKIRNTQHQQLTLSGKIEAEYVRPPPWDKIAGCLAHARRYWVKAAKEFDEAVPILSMFGRLFRLDKAAKLAEVGDETRLRYLSVGFAVLKSELDKLKPVKAGSSLHRALTYCDNQWPYLIVCTKDPIVPLSNNLAERLLRLGVLGRKNFQGSRSKRGARMAEVMYSIVNTCKLHDLHVANYLKAALLAAKYDKVLTPWQFAQDMSDSLVRDHD